MSPRIVLIALVAILFAACSRTAVFTDIIRNANYDVALQFPKVVTTGEETRLVLRTSRDSKPVTIEDELRMLHIVIASKDLKDLAHIIFPERVGIGQYKIPYTFLRPGPYRLWIEIESNAKEESHGPNADLIAYTDFGVTGEAEEHVIPESSSGEVTVDGYVFSVTPHVFGAREESLLRFTVKRTDGTPIELPSEAMLYGLTKNDFSFFSHGHTFTETDGRSATLSMTFPGEGDYGLVAQAYFVDDGMPKMIEGHFILSVGK